MNIKILNAIIGLITVEEIALQIEVEPTTVIVIIEQLQIQPVRIIQGNSYYEKTDVLQVIGHHALGTKGCF